MDIFHGDGTVNRAAFLLTLIVGMATATAAEASDTSPIGVYIGGSIGQSRDVLSRYSLDSVKGNGWEATLGVRPSSYFGAEVEYLHFGSRTVNFGGNVRDYARATAPALFAVGYLPVPVSFLDIFAKAGLARTHTTASGAAPCSPAFLCIVTVSENRTESDFAFGVGAQVNIRTLSLRVAYESINTSVGRPNLLSLGAIWTFE
jgi:hypothetical protein